MSSNNKRANGRTYERKKNSKRTWDDLVGASSSSKDGDPFEMLQGDLSAEQQELLRLAGKLSVFDSWLASSYADLEAYQELVDGPNEIVQLDQSFIDAIYEETRKWEDENAESNEWFARVLESQREFKASMTNWQQYRLPIGAMGRD